MLGIMVIMMSMGSAQYEIWGTPYDYAYLEKKSIAIEDGLDYWLENNLDLKNDFIGTHDQADIIAMTELIWQKCQDPLPARLRWRTTHAWRSGTSSACRTAGRW